MNKTLLNLILTLAVFCAAAQAQAQAQGDTVAGKAKSVVCGACHGADGNSTNPVWPKLAGQGQKYLAKQLRDFRSGARKNVNMTAMAAPLSDADIDNLAAYFSIQTRKPGAASQDLVGLGEKIYRAGKPESGTPTCAACHSPTGAGNPAAGYPSLSGQHADYNVLQLKAFSQSNRANDPGEMMRAISHHLTEDEIKALASYVSGLH